MGVQSNQPKAQKGWLSRWTRKQWSRHWFVLKNGSLTYYRGPAAELCSFLDGVLDLSLIKHIEVPQQEEQVQQQQQQQQHPHSYQSSSIVFSHLSSQVAQQVAGQHQHLASNQQQQQQQQDLHFSFTLKMWNGECHLLSAASHAERQLWLAAINSCNNFDDDTASSDSSSSSQSSNISAKSTDVGSSCASSGAGSTTSLGSTAGACTASVATSAAKLNNRSVEPPKTTTMATNAQQYYHNAYQTQQQQQREAEISLEHLASKLKSVVRKRRDETPVEPHLCQPEPQLLTRQQKSSAVCAAANSAVKPASQSVAPGELAHEQTGQVSSVSQQQEQAHKRRLMCLRTDSTDDLSGEQAASQLIAAKQEQKESSQPKLIRRQSDDSDQHIDYEDEGEESSEDEEEEEESGGQQSDLINNGEPTNEDSQSSEEEEEEEDDDDDDDDDDDEQLEHSASENRQEQAGANGPSEARPKKRVTFDLSNQTMDSSSSSESASSMSSESADEDELSAATTTTLSSASSATSEEEEEEENEEEESDVEPADVVCSPPAAASQERAASPIKQIDLAKRRLELREQLKYSRQKAMDEDEDSTCELVRKMIERRKLRLQKREGAASERADGAPRECDIVAAAESATSTTEMETNDETATGDRGQEAQQTLGRQLEQLELRLKTAEFNSDSLERRLNDSYLGYSQLELSYKQLQLELAECRESQAASEAQARRKIDELTSELKASELRLLEAREKLLRYEEHLAKWQLINSQQVNSNSNSNLKSSQNHFHSHHQTHSGSGKQHSWLTKNYSQCLSALSARETKLKSQSESNQRQQVSSSTGAPTSGGAQQKPQLLLMHHHHQLKQTLALNQQQLSLKLLSQSKQIQRKLNELELKVDKIQSGGCSAKSANEIEREQDNNNPIAGHLLHRRQPTQHHLQQLVPSGSAAGAQAE